MKKRVLIVDDDFGVQDVFRLILEKAGYEVAVKGNGTDLLEDNYDLPHIFLLDKQISGVDGIDVCMHLKKHSNTKDIPVIMVSATPGLGPIAMNAGADDFLEKPFQIKELLFKISNLLR